MIHFHCKKIQDLVKEHGEIHFSELLIKGSPLSIGSNTFSPQNDCNFPPKGTTGKVAQMIPWMKFKDSPKSLYEKALSNGFEKCGPYPASSEDDEGYLIDPGGFMLLLQRDTSVSK